MAWMIKVCGITNLGDAECSIEGGATALGFNFYPPSPRFIAPEDALPMLRRLEGRTQRVGLFVVDPALDDGWAGRLEAVRDHLDALQLHGITDPADVPKTGLRTLIATSPDRVEGFRAFEIVVDISWGRGRVAPWDELRELSVPFILSGGLDAANLGEAIRRARPAGVDVCSGVESRPGVKSQARIEAFLEAARRHLTDRGENHD